jgi:hypothetical protein
LTPSSRENLKKIENVEFRLFLEGSQKKIFKPSALDIFKKEKKKSNNVGF